MEDIEAGETLLAQATANPGWAFERWTIQPDIDGINLTNATLTVPISASNNTTDYAVPAIFAQRDSVRVIPVPPDPAGNNWKTVEHSVNWGIILMYGGAIALGSALNTTGAAAWIVYNTIGAAELSPTLTIIIIAAVSLLLTEFISNAAVVSVLLPVAISLAQTKGISLEAVTLAVALPSGLTYTLPMGTPATAIAYSSGYMEMKHFLRIGPVMGVISLIVFAFVATFIWPLLGV